MIDILKAEIYKVYKRKFVLTLCFLCLLPILYGLGEYLHWKIIIIGAKLDLVTFITSMWSFTLILTVPIILLLIMSASLVAGEIEDGQILLEITRVDDRNKLILGKYFAIFLITLSFYMLNNFVSFLAYLFFLSNTSKGYSQIFTTHSYNLESILVSFCSLVFLIFMITLTFNFSTRKSSVISIMIGFASYLACMLLGYIDSISKFVPGYYTVVSNYHFSINTVCIQLIEMAILIFLLIMDSCRRFKAKEF
ncbi:MAG TPA: hypothetical protein K8W13_08385 [Enterococcus columbae]|nr:hypothetical protein [Enterococcus columbae]